MDFKHNFGQLDPWIMPADYDMDPIPGFQEHQSIPMGTLIARYKAGDTSVAHEVCGDDEYPFETYVDAFDIQDDLAQSRERPTEASDGPLTPVPGNRQQPAGAGSESSASGTAVEPPSGMAQAAVNVKPGDSETGN